MKLSIPFPPLHTVHASFPAHGVPPFTSLVNWLVSIPLSPLQRFHWFEHYFSALVQLLIILRQFMFVSKHPIPFHVPIILSVHMLLGFRSEPVGWMVPVTSYGFSYARFLLIHTNAFLGHYTFLCSRLIDPYIREFVSLLKNILSMSIL